MSRAAVTYYPVNIALHQTMTDRRREIARIQPHLGNLKPKALPLTIQPR